MKLRIDTERNSVEVTLSRRNLRTMLQKLDMESSARTIFTDEAFPWRLILVSEEDDEHYANRPPPGRLHPQTEKELRDG